MFRVMVKEEAGVGELEELKALGLFDKGEKLSTPQIRA